MREWSEVRAELFTEEEIRESDLRVASLSELVAARNEEKAQDIIPCTHDKGGQYD